jgi:hypothetical protein
MKQMQKIPKLSIPFLGLLVVTPPPFATFFVQMQKVQSKLLLMTQKDVKINPRITFIIAFELFSSGVTQCEHVLM